MKKDRQLMLVLDDYVFYAEDDGEQCVMEDGDGKLLSHNFFAEDTYTKDLAQIKMGLLEPYYISETSIYNMNAMTLDDDEIAIAEANSNKGRKTPPGGKKSKAAEPLFRDIVERYSTTRFDEHVLTNSDKPCVRFDDGEEYTYANWEAACELYAQPAILDDLSDMGISGVEEYLGNSNLAFLAAHDGAISKTISSLTSRESPSSFDETVHKASLAQEQQKEDPASPARREVKSHDGHQLQR